MTELPEHPGSITVEDYDGKKLTTVQVAVATEVREDGEVIVRLSGPRIEEAEYNIGELYEH
jgi:hypothetical protein